MNGRRVVLGVAMLGIALAMTGCSKDSADTKKGQENESASQKTINTGRACPSDELSC